MNGNQGRFRLLSFCPASPRRPGDGAADRSKHTPRGRPLSLWPAPGDSQPLSPQPGEERRAPALRDARAAARCPGSATASGRSCSPFAGTEVPKFGHSSLSFPVLRVGKGAGLGLLLLGFCCWFYLRMSVGDTGTERCPPRAARPTSNLAPECAGPSPQTLVMPARAWGEKEENKAKHPA